MPIRITNHPAPPQPPDPVHPSTLPEEIYVRLEFDNQDKAKRWCDDVTETLARPISDVGPFDRVVLWAPAHDGNAVYLSVLAMRLVRAQGGRYLPARELVSMGQLPAGLEMLIGSQTDERAYLQDH